MDGGTEQLVFEMIFHRSGVKVPIRGKAPRWLDAENMYQMILDPKIKTAPKEITDFAMEHWKAFKAIAGLKA